MSSPSRADRIHAALSRDLAGAAITIVDDSASHAGHSGAAPGGETHFRICIVSQDFTGLSRLARSRKVHQILQPELESGLHALSLELHAPED